MKFYPANFLKIEDNSCFLSLLDDIIKGAELSVYNLNMGWRWLAWLYRCHRDNLNIILDEKEIVFHQFHEPEYLNDEKAKYNREISNQLFFSTHFERLS
jgi:hypothetical protein